MSGDQPMLLSRGGVQARVRIGEGGVVDELLVDGRQALARTPWADAVVADPRPALSEAAWVARWRGGWQLCFPSTGQPDDGATTPQGFHGVASQAPWALVEAATDRASLCWEDALGLRAERTWQLTDDGISAVTSAVNGGPHPRRIAVAEHLILGGDVLAPLSTGATLALEVEAAAMLAPLDLAGRPAGALTRWPGSPDARWATIERSTPARVTAIVGSDEDAGRRHRVTARGPHVDATVSWWGLPHALLWEELGASPEPPWNGTVSALGIEPTSTPHGAGTGLADGIVTLAPGARMDWRTELAVRWAAA